MLFELTKPQKLIYNMEKFAGGAISIICGSVMLKGNIEPSSLETAVNTLYRINDALRIRVESTENDVVQTIQDYVPKKIETLRFTDKAQLVAYAEHYAKEPLNIYDSLCEMKIALLGDSSGILIKLHHIIGDAWTLSLLASQFCAVLSGETPTAYSYLDYVTSENDYLRSARYAKDQAFFLKQFETCCETTYLSDRQSRSFDTRRKTFCIDALHAKKISTYASAHDTTPFVIFMTALAVYINRIKENAEQFYIGTAVLNRTGIREKNTAGMFINTIPMLIKLKNAGSFEDNLAAVQEAAFSAFRHQKYNYGDILTDVRKKSPSTEKLYDVMLSYQNAVITGAENDFESAWYHNGAQAESLQVHIEDRDSQGIFRVHCDYQTEKFTEQEIKQLYEHMMNLLFDGISCTDKKLYELEMLSPEEKRTLLTDFNDTVVDYPKNKCVHTLFEEQASSMPENIAVVSRNATATYAELNTRANRIANGLIQHGINQGDIVALLLPKSLDLIATMLGVMKAGAAYLPLDIESPQDRIDFSIQSSGAKFIISTDNIESYISNNDTNPDLSVSTTAMCYGICTSGTTGVPKTVCIRHNNLLYYLNNVKNLYPLASANMPLFTKPCVDLTVTSIYLPLITGGCIYVYDGDLLHAMADIVQNTSLNIIKLTPTHMQIMNTSIPRREMANVRYVIAGGEVLNADVAARFLKAFGSHIQIHNEYGPTETTVGCMDYIYTGEEQTTSVSIGHPTNNTFVYVLDRFNNPLPVGQPGELCIAGDGVGAGYLNQCELTAQKFVPNPFGTGLLYKSGDLAIWEENGNLTFLGRNDFQVKIHGLRIELGEIESAICSVEGISQAAAIVRKDMSGRQLICAFYTETMPVAVEQIKNALKEKLPRYMLPHIFTVLPEMPLASSGKIDGKKLPDVDLTYMERNKEYKQPEGTMEKQVVTIMEKVLHYNPIGRDDNFFDLGGDSLKAIEFVTKAHNEGLYFDLQNVFDHPTAQELVEFIENGNRCKISYNENDFVLINRVLSQNTFEHATLPPKKDVGNLLLAGATGYLGIHLLANYLEHDTGIAYCLVRGKNKADSTRRLEELLNFYFGKKYDVRHRIVVLCADLKLERFGLADSEYNKLLATIDTVINAAASVKHYGSYQYFYETNVESVKALIRFCMDANAKLIHISTLSISGNGFVDQFDGYVSKTEKHFYESSFYIGQALDNVYAHSKFEAERAVLDAVSKGLRANIMRMGNLTNRLSDGAFQKNYESNAFLKRIKGLLELGAVPDYLQPLHIEFTPVDEAAKAVMTITRHFSTMQTVFHINNPNELFINSFVSYIRELGYDMAVVDGSEFAEKLRKTLNQSGTEFIFETFINDLNTDDRLNYDRNIRIENDFTVQYLQQLGFEWPQIDLEYLQKYISYFEKIGYWRSSR